MKKIIVIFLVMLSLHKSYGQNDTLQQQKSISSNIAKYLNQPFSVLYNDLTIKPKTVWAMTASKNIDIEPSHRFYFDVPDSDSDIYIYVEWQTPPLKTETKKYQNKSARIFNVQEYPTYQNLVIKKLEVYPLFKTIM